MQFVKEKSKKGEKGWGKGGVGLCSWLLDLTEKWSWERNGVGRRYDVGTHIVSNIC